MKKSELECKYADALLTGSKMQKQANELRNKALKMMDDPKSDMFKEGALILGFSKILNGYCSEIFK